MLTQTQKAKWKQTWSYDWIRVNIYLLSLLKVTFWEIFFSKFFFYLLYISFLRFTRLLNLLNKRTGLIHLIVKTCVQSFPQTFSHFQIIRIIIETSQTGACKEFLQPLLTIFDTPKIEGGVSFRRVYNR